MPGRKGHAWGNALGGYRKQPRVGGRFVGKGTPGARISNKTRNKAIRGKIYKGTAIAVGTGAVVGAGYYAHKSGLDKKLVKSPQVRVAVKYAKTAGGVVGRGVLDSRITQIGPNRYTVQRTVDTGKELAKALKRTNKTVRRAQRVQRPNILSAERAKKSQELLSLLDKTTGTSESDWSGDPIGGQRFGTSSRRPTKQSLQSAWEAYQRSPAGLRAWKARQNRMAGITVRGS